MNRIMKISLPIALVAGLVGAYHLALSQDQKTTSGAVSAPPPAFVGTAAVATNHVLQATVFSAGNWLSTSFPAGTYTAVNSPLTISCPGTTGSCTIQADMWVETGNTNTAGTPNNFAICTEVDGSFLQGNCYYSNNTPNDFSFVTGTRSDQSSGWSHGIHTIQTFLFTNNGTPVQQYNITYHIYKP